MKPKSSPTIFRKKFKTILVTRAADADPTVMVFGPEALIPLLTALYAELDANKEHFLSFALNARCNVSGWHHVSTGSLNTSLVHPRELFSAMLRLDAASRVLAHNHPSTNCDPSTVDLALTHRLVQAGMLLGIPVLDHIITGAIPESGLPNWKSFAQEGRL